MESYKKRTFLLGLLLLAFPIILFSINQQQTTQSKAAGTQLSFTVFLHGIGKGGDSLNANAQGNSNPLTKQKTLSVGVFNAQNVLVGSKAFPVTYNATNGNYTGSADFGALSSGAYTVVVRADKYLQRTANGIQNFTSGQSNTIAPVTLVAGDIVIDNAINIQDYNVLMNCFSDLAPAKSCTAQQKPLADLTDDGFVNALDYNLFIREIGNRSGEGNPTKVPTIAVQPTNVIQPTSTQPVTFATKLKYKAGSEHITTAAGVNTAAAMGITLSMNYHLDPNSSTATAMRAKGMTYLDRNIADMVYAACGSGVPIGSCNPTAAQENAVMNQVNSYLNSVKDDPTIAGYYIIDDYPGNVKNLLTRITQAVHTVHQNNPKPTVCAFVATLDFKTSANGQWLPAHYAFDKAIANYSAQACDVPDFYSYGVAQTSAGCIPSTQVDWTGSKLIPYIKSVLQSKGWNPNDGFMISPQTFDFGNVGCPGQEYNTPTGENIKTQTAAFCAAGATSTLSYIWTNPDGATSERGLQQMADWRTGYQEGINQCKQIWNTK